MKTKLVLWGANAQDERLLVAVELIVAENKVRVYTFPESEITEEVYQKMMSEWRDDKEYTLPENHTIHERELTVTEGILPEDVKVERTDVILRAQTEWNFVVLSSKLHTAYQSELNEIKEKIDNLNFFDNEVWEDLKSFWDKVQGQVRDRNLFKHHFWGLRDATNQLFAKMKELRMKVEEEFKGTSENEMKSFMASLEDIEEKAKKGLRLKPLFEELKSLQRKYHETEFTREHRSRVWSKLDACFKLVKEKRFGDSEDSGQSNLDRLQRRYNGLISAVGRMEQSIKRDREELNFQNKRIEDTDGQLEAQIREAKIRMIEERVKSKSEKLEDMYKTKEMLEQRMTVEKEKEEKRQQIEAAKKAAEAKIAEEIKSKAKEMEENAEQLEKAAEAIVETKKKTEAPKKKSTEEKVDEALEKVENKIEDVVTDAVDSVKAVAEVVGDKIEEAVEGLKDKKKKKEGDEEAMASGEKEESLVDKAKKVAADAVEKVKAAAEIVEDKIEKAVDDIEDKMKDKGDEAMASGKTEDSFMDKAKKAAAGAVEKVKAAAEVMEDKIEKIVDEIEDKMEAQEDESEDDKGDEEGLMDKAKKAFGKAVDNVKAVAEVMEDKVEDAMEQFSDEMKKEKAKAAQEDPKEEKKKDDSLLGKAKKIAGDVVENVKAAAEVIEDKIEGVVDEIKEEAEKEKAEDEAEEKEDDKKP